MSSPANSLLSRIANAVASPFYTRTRNARTAANNEANPGTNPGTPPTTPPPEDEHQSTASPPSTPHQTPTLDPLEQLRAAMTLLMQQQHNQNAMLQRQRQQQHEQQQQLITVLNKLDVTSIPTTDEEPPNDSSSAAAQISSLMTRVPRVIVPDHLVTDFTTDITKDVDTFLLQMDEALTRAGATQPHVKLSFVADFLSGRGALRINSVASLAWAKQAGLRIQHYAEPRPIKLPDKSIVYQRCYAANVTIHLGTTTTTFAHVPLLALACTSSPRVCVCSPCCP